MKIKICGITNLEDALHAIECGVDALGFVFYEQSPRYITPKDARQIIAQLPPFVECVGLFVNESVEVIDALCVQSGVARAQIHFDVDEIFLDAFKRPTLPVVRVKTPEDILQYSYRYRLVDAYSEAYGGTGERLNLDWFKGVDCSKIILAGGLTPENVGQVKSYGFYGVDVSSGVESVKGKKDSLKVKQFIAHAKSL